MIKKLLSSQIKSVTGAAIVLGAASFISRVIGVLRDRIFAHQFGAGDTLDAYYSAFRIPDLVYNLLIVGALSAGFIPVFIKIYKDKKEAWETLNSLLNLLGITLIVICSILFIFTPQIMQNLVPGFSPEKQHMTIVLTRIMFLSPFLLGISSLVSGVLQSTKNFLIYALTPIMYNSGIIFGALFLVPIFGEKGLAFGVVLGALLHLGIQLPILFSKGYRYKFLLNLKNKNVREIFKLTIPRALGLATAQVNILAITFLASTLNSGSIAIFNFANNLQFFPIGIIGYSFAVASFPTLSYLASRNHKNKMKEHISNAVNQIIFFIIPLTIIFLLLRAQIVRVALGSGSFDWEDTIRTMDALAFFSLSLFAQSLIPLFARIFYALKDTMTPFITGALASVINIILGIKLKDTGLGVSGLALAFSISMIIELIILWIWLKFRLGNLKEIKTLKSINIIALAGIFMSIAIQSLKYPLSKILNMETFVGVFLQGFIAGISGLIIYVLICRLFKLPEIEKIQNSLKIRWLRPKNVQGEIGEADEI